jgi:hypothetical protein
MEVKEMADNIKTKEQAITLCKKLQEDAHQEFGRYSTKMLPFARKRWVQLIEKFGLSTEDLTP